ncbi:hypothetical protein [Rhizobium sp. G21]|uniref:hypothetical protein n=1 Tax=Rhizobium sp. G21 TaxID=2758439 RepID=UPI0016047560|nr:hypothetical protein [Rhizobium sp. G21]MBB1250575.1 hypothetical protein [Rhizobium sp. G21]
MPKHIQFGMRKYAGGDTDATFRLAQPLDRQFRRDPRAYNCYRRVQWPAMLAFTKTVERYGIFVNKDALRQLTSEVSNFVEKTEQELMALVPWACESTTSKPARK